MSWLTNLVRPKITTQGKRGVKADIWEKCPGCGTLIYENDLREHLHVCHACGHHLRWALKNRLDALLDEGDRTEIKVTLPKDDPLGFKDRKAYKARLKEARAARGQDDAFAVVQGKIGGQSCVVAAMDFDFMAGSMGRAVGEAMVAGAEAALLAKVPLLIISVSGGARMQEGVLSLMQMARITAAIAKLKDAKLPYVCLLTDPTTGGVTASFAMQGDVLMAEPGALIGFAGPRVIQQTVGQVLPDGFQRAEYLLEHGMLDMVVARKDHKETLGRVFSLLTAGKTHAQGQRKKS